MKARVSWIDGRAFLGEAGSGHALLMDGDPAHGGRNLAARPMELLLLGLGGCAAYDVADMLERAREPLAGLELEIEAERAAEIPRVFTRIHLRYRVTGAGLSRAKVQRAIDLSAEKYCSASRMLEATAAITHELLLNET